MEIVRSILWNDKIWPHIHEDGQEKCDPIDHEGFNWMLVTDDDIAGVFLVHAKNTYCYEMHTCLLPKTWGAKAAKFAQILAGWAFNETRCKKLVTNVPAYNRAALRFARQGGMVQEGINRKSYLKNGKMIDQIMMGITKEEWLCRQ